MDITDALAIPAPDQCFFSTRYPLRAATSGAVRCNDTVELVVDSMRGSHPPSRSPPSLLSDSVAKFAAFDINQDIRQRPIRNATSQTHRSTDMIRRDRPTVFQGAL